MSFLNSIKSKLSRGSSLSAGHIPEDVMTVVKNISVVVRDSNDEDEGPRVIIFGLGSPVIYDKAKIVSRIAYLWPELSDRHIKRAERMVYSVVASQLRPGKAKKSRSNRYLDDLGVL